MLNKTQDDIIKNWGLDKSFTLVSICCITYNHEKFIEECLDGFLIQETNFPFEILIHDDASTDKTQNIIRKYVEQYPDIIKPVYQKENQFSQGIKPLQTYLLPNAKSKYIALCEGDDYWTDPLKLQKQVNFMENNDDYTVCFHFVKVIYENKEMGDSLYPTLSDFTSFSVENLLKTNFIQTNSVLYRNQFNYTIPKDILPGDWYLHLYHAQFGKIGFIDEIMSVYRRHSGGLWWDSYNNIDSLFMKHGIKHLMFFFEIFKLFQNNALYKDIILNKIIEIIERYKFALAINSQTNTSLLQKLVNIINNDDLKELLIKIIKFPILIQSSLFIDSGSGFNENNKISIEPIFKGNKISFTFDISNKSLIKFLRFDPIEGAFITLKIEQFYFMIKSKIKKISDLNIKTNGSIIDSNHYKFETLDPQIIIDNIPNGVNKLIIEGVFELSPLRSTIKNILYDKLSLGIQLSKNHKEITIYKSKIHEKNNLIHEKIKNNNKYSNRLRNFSLLYINDGEGFSPEKFLRFDNDIESGGFECNFTLTEYKNIVRMRFDPFEGYWGRVKITDISYTDYQGGVHQFDLNTISCNGVLDNDGYFSFTTFDPNIFIDLSGDITSLSVKGDREILDYKIIEKTNNEKIKKLYLTISSLNNTNKKHTTKITEQIKILDDKSKHINELIEIITMLKNSHSYKLGLLLTFPFRKIKNALRRIKRMLK